MKSRVFCPSCGTEVWVYKNPAVAVDIIIECDAGKEQGIVLIERRAFPYGWALPGGFIDYGESAEDAAVREAWEETSLHVELTRQLGTYSRPDRDPRGHTVSIVFVARARGFPRAADDAARAWLFTKGNLPSPLAFDHARILDDYFSSTSPIP